MEIYGIGTALPEHFIEQYDAATQAAALQGSGAAAAAIPAIYRRAGVRRRHSVLLETPTNGRGAQQSFYQPARFHADRGPATSLRMARFETEALPLAARASRSALEHAALDPAQIDHLVTVSCTGFQAPGVDIGLVETLKLRPDVSRTNVGFMGCHGALNGLRAAAAMQTADPKSHVLLCSVELCTLHQQYSELSDEIVANALFGDGAGALIGGPAGGPSGKRRPKLIAQGSAILPQTRDLMSWTIGDHGFEMKLSPRVPAVICENLGPWLSAWLAGCGLGVADVAGWAIHPGGPRIVNACGESLGLKGPQLAASRGILENYGNMSSATILFLIQSLTQNPARLPLVALAFGPGLTIEAALFD